MAKRPTISLTPEQAAFVGEIYKAARELNALLDRLPDMGLGAVGSFAPLSNGLPMWPLLTLKVAVVVYEDEWKEHLAPRAD